VADEEHLKIIRQGAAVWNDWRKKNPLKPVDLSEADLREAKLSRANLRGANLSTADLGKADLHGANLFKADLRGANLSGTDLSRANLSGADLSRADLFEADLRGAQLIATNLRSATLIGSYVYGVSVWNIKVDDRTKQQNLIITAFGEPVITVDNIKVAQFIYLLLTNKEIRDVIDTITSKAVLILGRFTPPERKEVLDALHTALPFVPIIQQGEKPFAMFNDLHHKYQWVLPPLSYHSSESLVARLKNAIIEPALEIRRKLALIKAQELPTKNVSDYPEDE
jgi:uncharacterized protein YjbI with pentapeptide repeats